MGTIIGEGITFDDVLLVPSYSEVIPKSGNLSTNLTKKIRSEYPVNECRYGYSYRASYGDRMARQEESALFIRICQLRHRLRR